MTGYGACCIENRCQLKVEFARRHGRNPKSSPNYRLQKQQVLFSEAAAGIQENKLQQKTETVFKE
jgi:hypothetical protein